MALIRNTIAAAVLLIATATSAISQDIPAEIIQRIKSATVCVQAIYPNKQEYNFGTAFFANDKGLLIGAAHYCQKDQTKIGLRNNELETFTAQYNGEIRILTPLYTRHVQTVTTTGLHIVYDLSVFIMDMKNDKERTPHLNIGDSTCVNELDTVICCGYPNEGNGLRMFNNPITSLNYSPLRNPSLIVTRISQNNIVMLTDGAKDNFFTINMQHCFGYSGGPVYHLQSNTVKGIYTGTQTDGDTSTMTSVSCVTPLNYLRDDLISRGLIASPTPVIQLNKPTQ